MIGRTIVATRSLTQDEMDNLDWYGHTTVLILDDGTEIVPSSDPEGNNAGCFWHVEAGELLE